MNPDAPRTPREETEMRLTALLMGELAPDEAAALHAQIAADPALAALHGRLRQATELLREASALPEPATAPVPAQLSPERRERLLAHFKGAPPAPIPAVLPAAPRRDWSWLVPLTLAASLTALLGGALVLEEFSGRAMRGGETHKFMSENDSDAMDGIVPETPQHWGESEVRQRSTEAPRASVLGRENVYRSAPATPAPAAPAPISAPAGSVETQLVTRFSRDHLSTLSGAAGAPLAPAPAPARPSAGFVPAPAQAVVKSAPLPELATVRALSPAAPRIPIAGEKERTRRLRNISAEPAATAAATDPADASISRSDFGVALNSDGFMTLNEPAASIRGATPIRGETPTATPRPERSQAAADAKPDAELFFDAGGIARGAGADPRVKADARFEKRNETIDKLADLALGEVALQEVRRAPQLERKKEQPASPTMPVTALGLERDVAQVRELDALSAEDRPIKMPVTDRRGFDTKGLAGRAEFWTENGAGNRQLSTASEGTDWDFAAPKPAATSAVETKAKPAQTAAAPGEKDVLARRLYESVDEVTKSGKLEVVAKAKKDVAETEELLAKMESPMPIPALKQLTDEEPVARTTLSPAPEPQPEIATSAQAFSTFSLNVSDVAFKLAGASLEQGKMPDPASVRSEEFINAFDYRDPEPAAGAPLAFAAERARYPFAQNRDLLRLSVKTAAAGRQPGRALNLVLLLDNSGSMERADRVRILHEALRVLAAQLQPQDKLSVVTFARTPRLWADGVAGDQAAKVTARVGEITPQGGTDLAAALDLGYATALKHYAPGSVNRVVLLTDGAANLGDVNPDALQQKVEAYRRQGVALDCFGIGWEGLDDTLLEALSRHGDGRYGFINTPEEAATEFAGQLAGALRVAASDVKVQVEWNPRRVTAYRQIGYAKHQLTKEQFRDNTVDAAEIGAAESGNALYVCEVNPRGIGDLATVRVRFKVPGTADYREHEWTVPFEREAAPLAQASSTLRLAGTASAFSEMLAGSPFAAEVTSDALLGLLNGAPAIYAPDPRPQKLEWMIRTAKSLTGR